MRVLHLALLIGLLLCPLVGWAEAPMRDVRQTVFTAEGKAAAGATVSASYTWQGKAVLRQATANADGVVTWTALPPVSVIVWGKDVSAGVLTGDAATVTTRLPMPMVDPSHSVSLRLLLPNPGGTAARAFWWPGLEYQRGVVFESAGHAQNEDGTPCLTGQWVISSGTHFICTAMSDAVPCGVATLDYYAPYDAAPERKLTYDLLLERHDGITVQGQCVTPDGKALSGLNRLRCTPLEVPGMPPAFFQTAEQQLSRDESLPPVRELPDGRFTLSVPAAGTYRLCVDLYDETMPLLPVLAVKVTPGMPEMKIPLPEPLCQVPAGSELIWYRRGEPLTPHCLQVAAGAPQMPVFGPRESLLAYWFHPAPNRMEVWHAFDLLAPSHSYTLRTYHLSVFDRKGEPLTDKALHGELRVFPPMPMRKTELANPMTREILGHHPDFNMPLLPPGGETPLDLWEVQQYAGCERDPRDISGQGMGVACVYRLPDTGESQVVTRYFPLPKPGEPTLLPTDLKSIYFAMPEAEYTAWREHGAATIAATFQPDNIPPCVFDADTLQTTMVSVPRAAKSVTLRWPGVGEIRDLALPADSNSAKTPIKLPEWKPGVVFAGKVCNVDGTPVVKATLTMATGFGTGGGITTPFTTDENGAFLINGMPPGGVVIHDAVRFELAPSWVITVPADGLRDKVLQRTERPLAIAWAPVAHRAEARRYTIWYLPDTGEPTRLDTRPYRLPAPGWIWLCDGVEGIAQCRRYTPEQGLLPPSLQQPSVGLYFPMGPYRVLPGNITLTGRGRYAGVIMQFKFPVWSPAPLLGMNVTQLDAVPPGEYTVSVDTGLGPTQVPVTVGEHDTMVRLPLPELPKRAHNLAESEEPDINTAFQEPD